ncbi:MAG TPA: Ig-like domain-containing protein [Ohtaekwangia sp.]|nr:Ig-like domain-containing protein [Ohtaekwangia sp.]
MNLNKYLHWIIVPLFALACARQTSPTGGPQDTIPPVMIGSSPKHETINFTGKSIELEFDEYIILNNPKEQIIVTPDIQKKYEISVKKKAVYITLENELEDSTTYSLNFREAVQDITEKNPARNLKLAFSTGSYIDSLSVAGSTIQLSNNKPLKDVTVALYQSDTFNIFKHKPTYITKVDDEGLFIIDNLKPGQYVVYAFEDKNRNLTVDSRNEKYGFLAEPYALSTDTTTSDIPLIKLDTRDLKLTSARPYNTYVNLKTTKGLYNYRIEVPGDSVRSIFGEDNANIRIYNTLQKNDSTQIQFTATDSIENKIDTTFYIKFNQRQNSPEPFELRHENFKIFQNTGLLTGKLFYNKPIATVDFDSIYLQVDSLTRINFSPEDLTWQPHNKSVSIKKLFEKNLFIPSATPEEDINGRSKPEKQNLTLYFGKSSFISVEMDSSAMIQQSLSPIRQEDTGILHVELNTTESHWITEVLDKNFSIIQKDTTNTKMVSFENLPPGDYQIRVITDSNKDSEWSPGNFFTRTEPEKITYYKNEKGITIITLKANWEVGPLLITF